MILNYFKCPYCFNTQVGKKFVECSECGYEDLIILTTEEIKKNFAVKKEKKKKKITH
ncbi:putative RNA polymerase [Bacillus sp. TS-2]|nr:putative RNA polymerase [Bacillus sp. TS-2]